MNSNLKLLSAGLLVAALAGCGGGGGGEMMEPEPTPEEACLAGDGVVYEGGVCKTAEDLRKEGRDAEADERDKADADKKAAEDAAAAQRMAKSLLAVLSSDGDSTATPPVDDPSTIMLVNTGYDDADMKDSTTISVMGKKFSEQYADVSGDSTITSVSGDGKVILTLAAGNHARIKGDAFSTGASKTHTHDKVRTVGGVTATYFSTPGSYHGVMGTYECTGTDACTSMVPANNEGLTLAGAWTFTPSSPDAPVTDADGLQYGWWATETAGSVSAVHAFYAGDTLIRITGGLPSAHGGGATYKGGAKGQYAIHRGTGGMNDSGSFTADAELKATFGTAPTISGTIDGFMGADGEMRDWTVMLGKMTQGTNAGQVDPAAISGSEGTLRSANNVVWTIGDDASAKAGGWEVAAFGNAADATTGAPSAVAGGFQASHGIANGHMIGAFGAEKE